MPKKLNTISHAAQQADISIETIRYYQRIGLTQEPHKPAQGYRLYSQELIDQLCFIKRAKQLGFSLTEITKLLLLDAGQCTETKYLAKTKLSIINDKIKDLKSLAKELKTLINSCENNNTPLNCPIIKSIKN